MSFLSDSERLASPVAHNITFKAKQGVFVRWDKESLEEVEIEVKGFIPIAVRSMVTGFCESAPKGKQNIWSNQVVAVSKEPLRVTVGGNPIKEGLWKDIKFEVSHHGGKFTPVVYAAMDGEIVKFMFSGACCAPWIEVQNESRACREDKPGVAIAGMSSQTKGDNEFLSPVFKLSPVLPETKANAEKLKAELDQYFAAYEELKQGEPEPIDQNEVDVEPVTASVAGDNQHQESGYDDPEIPF